MTDPNADDAPPMGKGLALLLMAIGAGMAAHFGMKIEDHLAKEGSGNAVAVIYVAAFVIIGIVLMVLGLRGYHHATVEEREQEDGNAPPSEDPRHHPFRDDDQRR